ncbi:hypothetical protein DPMN_047717 [Dreissena polymorpha]|uniref:Uncharacterized protein n=1 Tax=Dreissena polymorpha TaxID=45954 RepID=A0A9D4DA83_DREPO|nr:hypothetical protein DPMN_047717 [Dreissena polymorpha]
MKDTYCRADIGIIPSEPPSESSRVETFGIIKIGLVSSSLVSPGAAADSSSASPVGLRIFS